MKQPLLIRRIVLASALSAAAGCAPTGPARPDPAPPAAPVQYGTHAALADSIDYETTACHGFCPVFRVKVSRQGEGVFTGIEHVAVTGERMFRVTPEQYRDFAGRLARYRPDRDVRIVPGEPGCANAATDMSSVTLRWNQGLVDPATLELYYGCDRQANGAMIDAIGNAPDALPIGALIGERP